MDITVAICTWNRACLLDDTLMHLNDVLVPDGMKWEVLIINNNCSDHTADVVARHERAGLLPIRIVHEPEPGHSNARNCGVRNAAGETIVWTDDDVRVQRDWLVTYQSGINRYPNASFFGGKILPWYEVPPPAWIEDTIEYLGGIFAIRDLGDETFEFQNKIDVPYGANFAVRTEVQRKYAFDPRLGRKGTGMMSGDETTMIGRMMDDGHIGRWLPNCVLNHFIPAERLTIDYVRRFMFGMGQTDFVAGHSCDRPVAVLRLKAVMAEAKWRARKLIGSQSAWVKHMMRSSYAWGEIAARRAA